MPDYIFKTYIDSGREYYEYTDVTDREQTIKKRLSVLGKSDGAAVYGYAGAGGHHQEMDKALLAFTSPAPRTTCRS